MQRRARSQKEKVAKEENVPEIEEKHQQRRKTAKKALSLLIRCLKKVLEKMMKTDQPMMEKLMDRLNQILLLMTRCQKVVVQRMKIRKSVLCRALQWGL